MVFLILARDPSGDCWSRSILFKPYKIVSIFLDDILRLILLVPDDPFPKLFMPKSAIKSLSVAESYTDNVPSLSVACWFLKILFFSFKPDTISFSGPES